MKNKNSADDLMGEIWRVHQFDMQGRVIQYFQRGIAGMQATQESNTRCANYPIMIHIAVTETRFGRSANGGFDIMGK